MTDTQSRIFFSGHRSMVGSAMVRGLHAGGYSNVVTRSRAELDLLDQRAVHGFLAEQRPDYLFITAAKVGGIQANNLYRADSLYQNLHIEANLLHGAQLAGVQRLMLLGSSCIYPRDCPQPIKEEYLLTGPLEPTKEPYAIAKIAGIKLCESYNRQHGRQYVSVMPTNLYGPNDNYDLTPSHVLPALIRKAHEAKLRGDEEYVVGQRDTAPGVPVRRRSGRCVCAPDGARLRRTAGNIGTGEDVTIREPAQTVMDGGLRRPHRLRQQQARWHAEKAAQSGPPREPGLARSLASARGYSKGLRCGALSPVLISDMP